MTSEESGGWKASYDTEGLPLEVRERELKRSIKAVRRYLNQLEQAPAGNTAFVFAAGYDGLGGIHTPAVGFGDAEHCEILIAMMAIHVQGIEDEHA